MAELIEHLIQSDDFPPLITVAMPIYNAGRHLRSAVLSIVKQTSEDWELLIIDDGSTDGSLECIQDIKDPRIRVIRDDLNKGLAARLNEAIDLARGQFFARMDQDDISYPERFVRQVAMLDNDSNLDLVGVRSIAISQDDQVVGIFPYAINHSNICARPWNGFYLAHPSWMGKIEWFRRHRYATPGPYMCEDLELLLRSFSLSRFGVVPEVLFAYRLRDEFAFRKVVKTRWTVVKLQAKYFLPKKQFNYLILAIAAFVIKVTLDFFNIVLQKMSAPILLKYRGAVDKTVEVKWRAVLKNATSRFPNP